MFTWSAQCAAEELTDLDVAGFALTAAIAEDEEVEEPSERGGVKDMGTELVIFSNDAHGPKQ